ncbi:hypothetical protein TQ38_008765 [Novosphingobium sp. P6W]|nr:hypothetical protein TQ38_008765 [Novosphingobium sp. P6W]
MQPSVKIAVVASMGGIVLAVAAMQANRREHAPVASGASAAKTDTSEISRPPQHCRSATTPDPQCQAAWEAHRRRFFGNREPAQ